MNAVTASDSECEVLSSDESSDDDELWEIGAEGDSNHADVGDDDNSNDGDNHDGNNDGDGSCSDDVPLARQKKKKLKECKFETRTRRQFIPPDFNFIPDPESPVPDDYRIPIDYVNMFLTDDMLENLVVESNKYATEKIGSCSNFTIKQKFEPTLELLHDGYCSTSQDR